MSAWRRDGPSPITQIQATKNLDDIFGSFK
jgi:hypothetical protein